MYKLLTYKSKQFFWLIIKLSIVIGCGYFIWQKLTTNTNLHFSDFYKNLTANNILSLKNGFILLFFTFLNWFLEIKKWHSLILLVGKFSFATATKQSLAALTASLITPNRIGEYGAKAIYFKKTLRKQIVGLNFIGNFYQLLATLLFGTIGLLYFSNAHSIQFNIPSIYTNILLVVVFLIIGFLFLLKSKIGNSYLKKAIHFLNRIPLKINLKIAFLSFLKYAVFSHQFYFFLLLFHVDISYSDALCGITSMYLIASVIPMWSFLDVVLKGSVAVWVFSFLQVSSVTILSITTSMWLLNFVLPASIGCYFIITFKPKLAA